MAEVGNEPGWVVTFHAVGAGGMVAPTAFLTVTRETHFATIDCALGSGLTGARLTLRIEQLDDRAHHLLATAGRPIAARLHLFWRDTNRSVAGYLASLAGATDLVGGVGGPALAHALVGVIAVQRVSREVDDRRHVSVIEGIDLVAARLDARITSTLDAPDFAGAIAEVRRRTGLLIRDHGLPPSDGPHVGADVGRTYAEAVAGWAGALAQATRKGGRGHLLVRDGELHVGPRPVPLAGGAPVRLSVGGGFIEADLLEPVAREGKDSEVRRQLSVVLRGRGDLKPGDVLEIDLPPEYHGSLTPGLGDALGAAFSGPLVAPLDPEVFAHPVRIYVTSVQHRLGRATGFVTTLTGVEIADAADAWDVLPDDAPARAAGAGATGGAAADAATHAAEAIRGLAGALIGARQELEVGEVRAATSHGSDEPPGQTMTAWRGLAPADGAAGGARRLDVRREQPSVVRGVPYTTPFAWGKCGLVLPRYPGTRVLLGHRLGAPSDPIDLGALWPSGAGPDAEAGDYWLILPVDVDERGRATIADDQRPEPHAGAVTQDLIDAGGNRVIEVGKLTIRIGRDQLRPAGERPPVAADPVTIEHAGGKARIVIRQDGSISIETERDLELTAEGDIRMTAANVQVRVTGTMDVSG